MISSVALESAMIAWKLDIEKHVYERFDEVRLENVLNR